MVVLYLKQLTTSYIADLALQNRKLEPIYSLATGKFMLACTDVCYTPSSSKGIKFQVIAQGLLHILIIGSGIDA